MIVESRALFDILYDCRPSRRTRLDHVPRSLCQSIWFRQRFIDIVPELLYPSAHAIDMHRKFSPEHAQLSALWTKIEHERRRVNRSILYGNHIYRLKQNEELFSLQLRTLTFSSRFSLPKRPKRRRRCTHSLSLSLSLSLVDNFLRWNASPVAMAFTRRKWTASESEGWDVEVKWMEKITRRMTLGKRRRRNGQEVEKVLRLWQLVSRDSRNDKQKDILDKKDDKWTGGLPE